MPAEPRSTYDTRWPTGHLAWYLCGLALLIIAAHKALLQSPILSGDEYAYLAATLDAIDGQHRRLLDPMLQAVYTPMFTVFGVLAAKLALPLIPVYKILNLLFFCSASILFFAIARRHAKPDHMPLVALLLCLSPFSAYTAYMMPEALYYFLFAGVAAALILWLPTRPLPAITLAATFTGALMLTKPHAISIFLAVVSTLVMHRLAYAPTLLIGAARALLAVSLYVVGTLVVLIVLNRVISGALIINPYRLLGEFYQPFLEGSVDRTAFGGRLPVMLRNGTGHALAALLFGGIPLAVVAIAWLRDAKGAARGEVRWRPDEREFLMLAFTILAFAAMVMMTINFTAQVAAQQHGQILRLHGRYYSFALPLLFIVLFAATKRHDFPLSRPQRATILVLFVGAALLLRHKFTIFPWDFPEIVALTAIGSVMFGKVLKVLLIFSPLLLLLPARMSVQRLASCIWLFLFSTSLLFMFVWQKNQTNEFSSEIQAGRLAHLLAASDGVARDITVLGRDRYGRMSYFLFNLAANPRVLDAANPAHPSAADATSAGGWLFSLLAEPLDAPGLTASGSMGAARLYRFDHAAPYTVELLREWDGRQLQLNFGSGRDDGLLVGGNTAEPWGTWTASERAVVALPAIVTGKIRLTLDAWVVPEGTDTPLQLQLGDATASVALLQRRDTVTADLDVSRPSRELVLSGVRPVQPNPWDRPLAVALVGLRIERLGN